MVFDGVTLLFDGVWWCLLLFGVVWGFLGVTLL